jgi:hypothetical protein
MDNTFNERGVAITRNGLSAGGQLFALREIRATRIATVHKNRIVPVAISLTGLALAVFGALRGASVAIVPGVMLVVVGWLAWRTQDITHRLMIGTDSGEREALTSPDLEFVQRVEATLQRALSPAASAAPDARAAQSAR